MNAQNGTCQRPSTMAQFRSMVQSNAATPLRFINPVGKGDFSVQMLIKTAP